MSDRAAEAPERTLREWAKVWATSGDSEMVDAMRAAADEIDRLREQAEGLADALTIARRWIVFDEHPIGWNVDRLDEVLARYRGGDDGR